MPGIQVILGGRLPFQNFLIVIPCLIIFAGQERTPGDGTPGFMIRIQIIHFEEIVQGLCIILQFEVAVSDTDLDRQIIRVLLFITLVIFQCLGRLFETSVTVTDTADDPFAVWMDQIALLVGLQGTCQIIQHLFAITDFLVQDGIVGRIGTHTTVNLQSLFEMVLFQIGFGEECQRLFVGHIGL